MEVIGVNNPLDLGRLLEFRYHLYNITNNFWLFRIDNMEIFVFGRA